MKFFIKILDCNRIVDDNCSFRIYIIKYIASIYIISMFFDHFLELTVIANAFKGIKIGVGLLILDAAFTMLKKMRKKTLSKMLVIGSCISMLCINFFAWNLSSISLMLIAAFISLTLFTLNNKPRQKGGAQR